MATSLTPLNKPSRPRLSWLRFVLRIACHPAFANFTPTGPGALASGQVGSTVQWISTDMTVAKRDDERLAHADSGAVGHC